MKSKMKKRMVMLTAVLLLLPTLLSGCMSADELAERREKTDEVGRKAEAYMLEKYNRAFAVKKCEFAEGDAYEGDFFITFQNDLHAYYDTDEDLFYDDRQADAINNDIYQDVWMPKISSLGVFDNIGTWSQVFNMKYQVNKGGELKQYSMYHEYYRGSAAYYVKTTPISVTSQNLILISDSENAAQGYFLRLKDWVAGNFKGQSSGDLRFYVITNDFHRSVNYKPEIIDETMDGCTGSLRFAKEFTYTQHAFTPVADGLYAMLCDNNGVLPTAEEMVLVPVSDSDAVSQKILANMNEKDMNLLDKYVTKKRSITFEKIYKLTLPDTAKPIGDEKRITVAFVMKDNDDIITEYASIKERERSFFAYNMNGTDYNATCLCSQNSRSVRFSYAEGDDVYFWFGTQF